MVIEKKAFGARIRNLREEKELSQSELAEYLEVTPSCVANWEMGTRAPDINIWGKLSEYFNVSVDYLCCRSNQRNYIARRDIEMFDMNMLDLSLLNEADRVRVKKYYEFLMKKSKKAE